MVDHGRPRLVGTIRIRTYEEAHWAELPDAKTAQVAISLDFLAGLHGRWVAFLRALPDGDFSRMFKHPEWGSVTISEAVAMCAWHCRHHTAHIKQALGVG